MIDREAAQSALVQRFAAALIFFLAISAGCYIYLLPDLASFQQMKTAANDGVISINIQMNDLSARKAREAQDRNKFDLLAGRGFIGPQNRLDAARILESLRVQHRISSLEYQIEPVKTVTILRQSGNSSETLNVSEISLNMRGFLDSDLRNFIAALKRGLPGFVTITEVEMEKISAPDAALLSQISLGGGSELVEGSLKILWQAMQDSPQPDGS